MNHRNFITELKRRNVYNVGVAYAVAAALAQHARGDQAAAEAALNKLIAAQGGNFPGSEMSR